MDGGEYGGELGMDSASQFYPNPDAWTWCQITVYDVRSGEALARFWSERDAWAEYAGVEALDEHHYVMIVRPGLARDTAA